MAKNDQTVDGFWLQSDSLDIHNFIVRKWEILERKMVYQTTLPRVCIRDVLNRSRFGEHCGVNRSLAKIRHKFEWLNCRQNAVQMMRNMYIT